jgi:uncharacterized protein
MRVVGSFELPQSRAAVWDKIRDPAVVASCVPGCEMVEALSPTSYRARVTVTVGPITARFNVVVELTKEEPLERVLSTTRGEEGTRASVVSAENVLRLSDLPGGGTHVDYESEVSIIGRLGKFGLGVMKKKADALGVQFAEAFQARLANDSSA